MLKYVDTKVVFVEVPDEITLAISISGCPCFCEGCHSAYLAKDIGKELTFEELDSLIKNNKGITCVGFMGGDVYPAGIDMLACYIKANIPELKVAWYSGREQVSTRVNLRNFDYIKIGPYIKEKGPINDKSTNQRFYKVITRDNIIELEDLTYKFWKDDKV